MGLYDRVDSKRKQKKVDVGQDDKIKGLEKLIKDNNENTQKMLKDKDSEKEHALRNSLTESGPMIRREYNRDFARFGDRFAKGDCECPSFDPGAFVALCGCYLCATSY
jgi:hypothetical protein